MEHKKYWANAFISCSLNVHDKPFVDYVCRILKALGVQPFGTVGLFSASPENPIVLMNKNIEKSDMIVICATSRYLSKDIYSGKHSNTISEMIHVETGIALALGKPVIVFVKKGTDVGKAIPNITQYIVLNMSNEDNDKEHLIESLFGNAYDFIVKQKKKLKNKRVGNGILKGLAILGGVALFDLLIGDDDEDDDG